MATAPSLIAEQETTLAGTSPRTVAASITALVNDILVEMAGLEDSTDTLGTPTGGTSVTRTLRASQDAGANTSCEARAWTAPITSGQTFTPSFNNSGTKFWIGTAMLFRGSDGVGANASTNNGTGSGGPSLSITTTADNSAIIVVVADWNAVDGATRTWRTVNGTTPTAGNGFERTYARDAVRFTYYAAYYPDAGTAGAKTVGLSAPSTMRYVICAVEIKGAAGGALQALTPGLFTEADTFFAEVLANLNSIAPPLFSDADTFYAGVISTGPVTLGPTLFSQTNTFYTEVVTPGAITLTPGLFSDADSFFGPAIGLGLSAALFSDADSFFAPAISVGPVTLTASLFSNANSFYTEVVSEGAVVLTPTTFVDADAFFGSVITTGAVSLTPSLFTDVPTFYSATVDRGPVSISPTLFADPDIFYAEVVTRGTVSLSPSLFTDADTFLTPTITVGVVNLTPSLFTDADTFYTQIIANGLILSAPLLVDVDTFYTPIVGRGAVSLAPALFVESDTFFTPTIVAPEPQALVAALFASSNIFYVPVVHGLASLLNVHVQLKAPHIFNGSLWPTDTVFSARPNIGEVLVPAGFSYSPLMVGLSPESQVGIAQAAIDVFGRYDGNGNLLDSPPIPRPIWDPQPTPPVGTKHLLPLGNTD